MSQDIVAPLFGPLVITTDAALAPAIIEGIVLDAHLTHPPTHTHTLTGINKQLIT